MAQSSEDSQEERKKAKLSHPDAFLDELDGDPNQDADALLAQFAPNIDKELGQLTSDFADLNLEIESLDLDGDNSAPAGLSLKERLTNLKKKLKEKAIDLAAKAFYHLKYFGIWIIFEAPKKVAKFAKLILGKVRNIYGIFAGWSRKRKILFVVYSVTLTSATYFYFQVVKSKVLYRESFQFHGSMDELADYAFSYDADSSTEPFYNSPRVKAYSFQMKPVVVNLKRRDPDRENPMAFFEFVFEGSSGDVVVDLKARESEFVDLVERVLEDHTYESLDTLDGKSILKEDLRQELNKQLTDGIIRRVEIRNFFIKP